MDQNKKQRRYQRLYTQIKDLIDKSSNNRLSNMATIIAVLHHKMDYFFWTGFYFLHDEKLQVGSYQGSLACINLAKNSGVCWSAINQQKTIVVSDVREFPGHIACDGRSLSEIVIPIKNKNKSIIGVLDIDSSELNSFNDTDILWLEKIVELI